MVQKLSFKEKFGYSLGDMAANFIFQFMIALQLDFYTHTFGLTPAQTGTLFGVGPLPDGASSGPGFCGRLCPSALAEF
jgi:GPH family glycoside/pentoside/hexuronide:cation symporter